VTADVARSPLAHRAEDLGLIQAATEGAIAVEEQPFLAQVDLRLDPADTRRAPYPVPLTPNTAWEQGARAALWLGPDEWLIIGPPGGVTAIVAELDAALAGLHHSAIDVSAGRAALELEGPGARDLLSKGCSLDLHPRVWTVGSCAQTLLAAAPVILCERKDRTRVLVRSSFADYLADWLVDAAGRGN